MSDKRKKKWKAIRTKQWDERPCANCGHERKWHVANGCRLLMARAFGESYCPCLTRKSSMKAFGLILRRFKTEGVQREVLRDDEEGGT